MDKYIAKLSFVQLVACVSSSLARLVQYALADEVIDVACRGVSNS